MYLKPGMEEEYRKRHAEIWTELKTLLTERGVRDYTIFLDRKTNTLFAVQKSISESGSQEPGVGGIIQKWWDYMSDIVEMNPDNSPVTIPLDQIFHMD